LREREVQHRHLLLRCERGLSRRIVRHAVRPLLLTFLGRSPYAAQGAAREGFLLASVCGSQRTADRHFRPRRALPHRKHGQ
jgi:hypothetical protein